MSSSGNSFAISASRHIRLYSTLQPQKEFKISMFSSICNALIGSISYDLVVICPCYTFVTGFNIPKNISLKWFEGLTELGNTDIIEPNVLAIWAE